jgi:hypothetical protein
VPFCDVAAAAVGAGIGGAAARAGGRRWPWKEYEAAGRLLLLALLLVLARTTGIVRDDDPQRAWPEARASINIL